ncbi:hypothetical protein [Micromonospora sp. NPDC005161]
MDEIGPPVQVHLEDLYRRTSLQGPGSVSAVVAPRSTPPADGSVAALVWASVPLDQSNRDDGLALARQIRLAVEGAAGRTVTATRLDR